MDEDGEMVDEQGSNAEVEETDEMKEAVVPRG